MNIADINKQIFALQLQSAAMTYRNLFSFSISPIVGECNKAGKEKEKSFKNPFYDRDNMDFNISSYNWGQATGLGVHLGKDHIWALDIDNIDKNKRKDLISDFLYRLRLPEDYAWVVNSGSRSGCHIIFKSQSIDDSLLENPALTFAFNKDHMSISLRMNAFLVLPPSLHVSGETYEFMQRRMPSYPPQFISIDSIYSLLSNYYGVDDVVYLKSDPSIYLYRKGIVKCSKANSSGDEEFIFNDEIELLKCCHIPEALNSLGCLYAQNAFEGNSGKKLYERNRLLQLSLKCFNEADNEDANNNALAIQAFLNKDIYDPLKHYGDYRYIYLKTHGYKYLFVDTETTGLPKKADASYKDIDNWPRLVQISWLCVDEDGEIIAKENRYIIPVGYLIPEDAAKIHGVTTNKAINWGEDIVEVLKVFCDCAYYADCIVGHNVGYDLKVICSEIYRSHWDYTIDTHDYRGWSQYDLYHNDYCKYDAYILRLPVIDIMKESINHCKIPGYNGYKYPKLQELYRCLFGKDFENAHDSLADIKATLECFNELKRKGIISE